MSNRIKCIVPRCKRKATKHHFPIRKSEEGTITIDICRHHHDKADRNDKEILNLLSIEAPFYWMEKGMWQEAREPFLQWLKTYKKENTDGY